MTDVMNWISSAVSMIGCFSVVLAVALWRSAYLCRVVASALLAYADTMVSARLEMKMRWEAYHGLLVENRDEIRRSHGGQGRK